MKHRRLLPLWMPCLAAAGLLVLPAWGASGQVRVIDEAEALGTGRAQTLVITQRPLRTFRGEAVRVGRFAEDRRASGVVRPLRPVPTAASRFDRFRSYDSFGRPARVYVDSYRYSQPFETQSGVVRPFITYDPPVRNLPNTFSNPNASAASGIESSASPGVLSPASDARPVLSQDVEITAVEAVEVPDTHRDDPWTLLDHGYYREARQRFAQLGTVDDTVARTGHALAAALSGDLVGGAALMPDAPELPDSVTFRPATVERLEMIGRYLYADNAAMQAKIQVVLDATAPATARAE